MSEYTKITADYTGDYEDGYPMELCELGVGGERIALLKSERYAPLIEKSVNACISINPEHPEVVAEGMGELVEGCETYCRTQNPDRMLQALFKITGGK